MVDLNSGIGALFDLDGVLIDSEGIYTDFWNGVDAIYPTGINDFAHVIKGCTLPHILDTYFPEQERQEHIKRLLEQHEQTMEYRLFDGVYDFVYALKERGIPMAIVTSSTRIKMSHMIEQLPDFLLTLLLRKMFVTGNLTRRDILLERDISILILRIV